MNIYEILKNNERNKNPFPEIMIIDFYDGPTEALCRLPDLQQWIICSLVYIDFNLRERIYSMLELTSDEVDNFSLIYKSRKPNNWDFYDQLKKQVKQVYQNYDGVIVLFKSEMIGELEYEVVEILPEDLQYFDDIEEVVKQTEESRMKWRGFFQVSA